MTIIQRLDGTTYDLAELGIRTKDIVISSLSPRHSTTEQDSVDGLRDNGTVYEARTINASYKMVAHDYADFPLARDEVFHLFRTKEPFYFIEKRRRGKRWLVKVNSDFDIPQNFVYGDFDIEFISYSPYSESIGTTADLEANGIDFESELWGFGMGLITDADSLIYTHTTNTFRIYNAGNIEQHHPFSQELNITISDVAGSTSFLELRNTTNNTYFRATEAVSNMQTIFIDGAKVTSNDLAYLRNTDMTFIALEHGWNEFEITGATTAKTEFNFRFYYI